MHLHCLHEHILSIFSCQPSPIQSFDNSGDKFVSSPLSAKLTSVLRSTEKAEQPQKFGPV